MKYIRILLFTLVLFLVACGGKIEPTMSSEVADFNFTTQDGDKLGLEDLKGDYWIADFIFTNCTSVCIPMTTNMTALQDDLAEKDLDIQFVSFTVDPEYDSPEVLKSYAESYDADLSNWTFLTGYDFETIEDISVKSFLSGLSEIPGTDQVQHGVRFFLVNPEGVVIKSYDGTSKNDVEDLMDDLKKVL